VTVVSGGSQGAQACWLLTETTSPSHAVPLGRRAPVDRASGALSVGVPVFNTVARILGDDGRELPPGEVGEIAISGPMVVPGYWNRPDATERTLPGGELRTGDVGFMDRDGWFYLVDRKKDMIVASGYKVWPREVEDTLLRHPAVREAAVVGVPDAYRGETVWAYVSLRPGAAAKASVQLAVATWWVSTIRPLVSRGSARAWPTTPGSRDFTPGCPLNRCVTIRAPAPAAASSTARASVSGTSPQSPPSCQVPRPTTDTGRAVRPSMRSSTRNDLSGRRPSARR